VGRKRARTGPCRVCKGTGRGAEVKDVFRLLFVENDRLARTDLRDLELDVALELTRATYFPDLDGQIVFKGRSRGWEVYT
jgi:hypothetical protein